MLGTKEWHRDEDGVAGRLVQLSDYLHADRPVSDVIEATQRGAVVEDDFGHKGSVQVSVVRQYGTAKRVDERRQRRRSLGGDVVGHVVRVDDGEAQGL